MCDLDSNIFFQSALSVSIIKYFDASSWLTLNCFQTALTLYQSSRTLKIVFKVG